MAAKSTSLLKLARMAGLRLATAFFPSKEAPMAMSPKGVARTATLCTVFSMISGMVRPERDQREPATMPRMIGLVRIPSDGFLQQRTINGLDAGL